MGASMRPPTLSPSEIARVSDHARSEGITLAVVRTEHAPTELTPLFEAISQSTGLPLMRNLWSPASDFGFAEFYSNGKMLVLLYLGGPRTELVSVSETDDATVADLEETVCSSNIQSSTIRDGL